MKMKTLTSFNINKGIREATKHITVCPSKQAVGDGNQRCPHVTKRGDQEDIQS